jgi:heme A synthase
VSRDNLVGILLLGVCGLALGVMLAYIRAGERPTYTGPGWLAGAIAVLFIGLLIFGAIRGRGAGAFTRDDVGAPRPSWWRRLRRRK